MRILITGAAGLIGSEVAVRLAARGHSIVALVHRDPHIIGNDRTPASTRPYGSQPPSPGEIATLTGTISASGLGLQAPPAVDLIIHSAAITAFDAAPALYEAVNIAGARHVSALAASAGVPLLHVSTAYVCGAADGVVSEKRIGHSFVNGYEASKAEAERLIAASGARHAIARPSIVVGDWASGQIRDFTNIYGLFRLIAAGLVPVLPAAPHATLDLVPIDHVATGIIAMAEGFAGVEGKTLHLVAEKPTPLAALAAAIAAVPGLGHVAFTANAPPLPRRIAAVAGLYTPYLLRSPAFDTSIASAHVPPCPSTDAAWLARLIGFCITDGFVAPRAERNLQRTSG